MVRLLVVLLLYALGVVALAFLHPHRFALTGALAVLILVTASVWRRPGDRWFVAAGLVFGPIAEAVAISRGAWTYARPDIVGIPIWLPVAWAFATLCTKRLAEAIGALTRAET